MNPWASVYTNWADALHARWTPSNLGALVSAAYHPLVYARKPFLAFLQRLGTHPRPLLFLGMNPGPWGMTQTGVPFGSVPLVRDWMGIEGPVGRPEVEHSARPVTGFQCLRTEISGRRFWGLMQRRFGTLDSFAQLHAVHTFCPLVFMDDAGRNVTPDRLEPAIRAEMEPQCSLVVQRLVELWKVQRVICLGKWAWKQAIQSGLPHPVLLIHPSPINPGAQNWEEKAEQALVQQGIWAEGNAR